MNTMSHVDLITRRKVIKKITMINGVPTETEEEIVEPEVKDLGISHERLIARRNIIKKIVMINGVPTETEEEIVEPEIEDPENVDLSTDSGKESIDGMPMEVERTEVPKEI